MKEESKPVKLVNGNIPAGKPCPFLDQCKFRNENCPTEEAPRQRDFSCAVARAFVTIEAMGGSISDIGKV